MEVMERCGLQGMVSASARDGVPSLCRLEKARKAHRDWLKFGRSYST